LSELEIRDFVAVHAETGITIVVAVPQLLAMLAIKCGKSLTGCRIDAIERSGMIAGGWSLRAATGLNVSRHFFGGIHRKFGGNCVICLRRRQA